ncbi:hypothetical protein ACTQXY_02215 [Faecalimonas sp. LCP19S3_D12]
MACTIFTSGCNLRCLFCHNVPLVLGTGQAEKYREEVKELGFLVKLDTNGSFP